ncbi:MAG: comC [Bacillales bacterium]|jgi:prepilin signal peptidase PulO-like enzyme (type II secretory pathway)|nr:comC [Bacillales bacterium]
MVILGFLLGCISYQLGKSIEIRIKEIFGIRQLIQNIKFVLLTGILCAYIFFILQNYYIPLKTSANSYIFIILLLIISINDYYYLNIRLEYLIATFILQIIISDKVYLNFVFSNIINTLALFVIFIILSKIFQNSFGDGDIYVFLVICLFYGMIFTLKVIYFSIIFGGILSIILLYLNKVNKKDSLPFVPFIFFSFLICLLIYN